MGPVAPVDIRGLDTTVDLAASRDRERTLQGAVDRIRPAEPTGRCPDS